MRRPLFQSKRRSTVQGLAVRARIVPACANGWNNTVVAARLGVGRDTVRRWRTLFLARRLDGLADEPRARGAADHHPFTSPRRPMPSSSRWTRNHRSRLLSGPRPVLPMIPGVPGAAE
ncbi:helix-turn-helix domain-containing protein [Streptomyces fungicidicus]|uniref:helix-turn-helix domain-containing protein n=1 Tax=Streptomyces fungicidicus TaxID=68203 RepID=UPI001F0C14F1|nr:helix-turn-helix domain-containing protein [Streptomyces fungicidicus]